MRIERATFVLLGCEHVAAESHAIPERVSLFLRESGSFIRGQDVEPNGQESVSAPRPATVLFNCSTAFRVAPNAGGRSGLHHLRQDCRKCFRQDCEIQPKGHVPAIKDVHVDHFNERRFVLYAVASSPWTETLSGCP